VTILAWDGVHLAADSWTLGNDDLILNREYQKIKVIHENQVLACSGDVDVGCALAARLEKGLPLTPILVSDPAYYNVTALWWNGYQMHVIWTRGACYPTPLHHPFAIGVGNDVAQYLLKRGYSAVDAVEAVIDMYATCGGKVQYCELVLGKLVKVQTREYV
jgi:hypothetical protein